ncbi:hypothetical protein ACFU99_23815 [Streptomyces sp. NPDC057654]|uniref:effector-associated constant component EACC1 n=1 Tax=Streptomyces sp. NPDC057654 TaxID=3346196 RepID=UPI00369D54D2
MSVELRVYVNDGGELEDLREWMGGHPGVAVRPVARAPERNSQGTVWDFLAVVCATGGPVVAAVRALQLWIEAQVTAIEVEAGDRRIKVTSRNAGAVLPQVLAAAQALQAASPEPPEGPDEPA